MSSTSETGHAKNVANLEDIISYCTGYGATYNPTKNSIKLPALNTLITTARASVVAVNTANTALNTTIDARVIAFEPLKKLATKVINALDATDAKKQTVANATLIVQKLQGRRAKAIPKTKSEPQVDTQNGVEAQAKTISVSQLSYDSQIENLSKLILLLQAEPLYIPNETELKTATLIALLATLKTTNTAVIAATTPVSNARIARNKILYNPDLGVHDIAQEVKKYVKSVFGATSPEYKQIAALKFKAMPK